jgi:hypothetical protein
MSQGDRLGPRRNHDTDGRVGAEPVGQTEPADSVPTTT